MMLRKLLLLPLNYCMTDAFGKHGWKLDGNEKLDCINKVFSVLKHENKKVQFFFSLKTLTLITLLMALAAFTLLVANITTYLHLTC